MALSLSERMDLFQRFKDKDIDKLLKLSVTFKANKNYDKAHLTDLLIKIKTQDIDGLKRLTKELSRSGALMESVYADSLLQEKLSRKTEERKQAKKQKKMAKREKKEEPEEDKSIPPFGLTDEVYEAMSKRIALNSQRHKDRIKGASETE